MARKISIEGLLAESEKLEEYSEKDSIDKFLYHDYDCVFIPKFGYYYQFEEMLLSVDENNLLRTKVDAYTKEIMNGFLEK